MFHLKASIYFQLEKKKKEATHLSLIRVVAFGCCQGGSMVWIIHVLEVVWVGLARSSACLVDQFFSTQCLPTPANSKTVEEPALPTLVCINQAASHGSCLLKCFCLSPPPLPLQTSQEKP